MARATSRVTPTNRATRDRDRHRRRPQVERLEDRCLLSAGFSDGFEGPTLDPFWSTSTQSGSISLTTSVVHGGNRSAQFSSTSTGLDKHINLFHDFSSPTYGTVSVWFYDTGAGQPSSNYIGLAVNQRGTNFAAGLVAYDYGFAGGGPGRGDQYDYYDFPIVMNSPATGIDRTQAWHQYMVQTTPQALTLLVDGVPVYTRGGATPFDQVELSMSGPSWRPAWTTYFDDFSFVPPATLSVNDVTVTEGDSGTTNATFTVSMPDASADPVTVHYATADGTATVADGDYTAASGDLTFLPGETSKTVAVGVTGDQNIEFDETFFVNLSNASNATISRAQGVGTIRNDDGFALGLGGPSNDLARAVATDAAGNVYVAGGFNGTADFDPSPTTSVSLTSKGVRDAFVAKYTPDGALLWARGLGGAGDDFGHSVALDAAGNVYLAGWFQGTADFDPGPGTLNLTSAGGFDAFVLRLDPAGNLAWAKSVGGAGQDYAYSVAVDAAGNVYATGEFEGTGDFDPGPATLILTSAGNADVFVVKLTAAGGLDRAWGLGGVGPDSAMAVVAGGTDGVYLGGRFQGTVDFDPGPGTYPLTSAGDNDGFVMKLTGTGALTWVRALSGVDGQGLYSLAVDAAGNVYAGGFFGGTTDFDPGPGTYSLTR